MAIITGGSGNNTLYGTADAGDTISGLGGDDTLTDASRGDDILLGGDGNDILSVYRFLSNGPAPSNVLLDGGAGNDLLRVQVDAGAGAVTATLDGGSGDDIISVIGQVAAMIIGGDGSDTVYYDTAITSATLTLGAGTDYVRPTNIYAIPATAITITDFAAGNAGDVIDIAYDGLGWLKYFLTGWDQTNPFATGFMRTVQSGSDTLVQVDRNGGGDSWQTFVILSNVSASALTAFNFSGFAPDGSPPIGQTFNGTAASDSLVGTVGGDTINGLDGNDQLYGLSGADFLYGGNGDDTLYGGAQDDVLEGGAGNDNLIGAAGDTLRGGADDDYLSTYDQLLELGGVFGAVGAQAILDGGDGNDTINITVYASRNQSATATGGNGADVISFSQGALANIDGGADNDTINIDTDATSSTAIVNASGGTGNDLFVLNTGFGQSITLTLGSGADIIRQNIDANLILTAPAVNVTDFTPGSVGDKISFIPWLDQVLTNWDHSINPFSTGHLRARQSGADTLLEIDRDGGGNGYQLYMTLQGVTVSTLTAFNFDGYNRNGSTAAGQTINGTANDDILFGGTGGDTINGQGGNDTVYAGPGNDMINSTSGDDMLFGEGGNDIITFGSADSSGSADGGYGNDTITANGGGSLTGGEGNDTLSGSAFGNTFTGGLGFDTINGGAGNDFIGIEDSDVVNAGGGTDVLNFNFSAATVGFSIDLSTLWSGGTVTYGTGSIRNAEDVLGYVGSAFDDVFILGSGAPIGADARFLTSGGGNDTITGSNGADQIVGGDGNDILNGLNGANTIDGGAGNDQITGGADADFIIAGFGSDTVNAGGGDDIIYDGQFVTPVTDDSVDQLNGGDGNDTIWSTFGADIIAGGAGNDTINVIGSGGSVIGGDGDDTIYLAGDASINGGNGYDVLALGLSGLNHGVAFNFSSYWSGGGIGYSGGTITGIEYFTLAQLTEFADTFVVGGGGTTGFGVLAGDGNDVLIGGDAADTFLGGAGNDVLSGGAGNDRLEGGSGLNELIGGLGDDVFVVANAADSIVEYTNQGRDRVETVLAVYTLPGGIEDLYGTNGDGSAFVGVGNALGNVISAFGRGDTLIGNDGNDTLWGGGPFGTPVGSTLIGGMGDDIYEVAHRLDSMIELVGEGTDTVRSSGAIQVLQNNVENLIFVQNNNSLGIGNALDNVITGTQSSDELFGREGNDTLIGGAGAANTLLGQEGDDLYIVAALGDSVIEFAGQGNDTVQTALASFVLRDNVENLTYTGTAAFTGIGSTDGNVMTAGAGADFLSGLGGDDILIGGSGADIMLGGGGADQYRYVGGETGLDRILDFTSGSDKIALLNSYFTPTASVGFVQGNAATTANSTFLYDTVTGIVSYDDDGTGAGAAIQIAQLNPGLTLTAGDFLFY
jgi:Ca2+-binding RTX toxin-like protein